MARAVEKAFEDKRHLIVEAGTGTGKTLAYLLPALRLARERNQRVIISTGTKNLQEQLYFKDVPFLESVLTESGPLKVCYMKGRSNYLCKHKLYALRASPLLNGLEEISQFHHIAEWERTTETGDRAELHNLPETSALWSKLDARTEACLGQTCPDWESCFITSMRRKALESELIIVNHHLFFADLSIKQQAAGAPDAGILPEAAVVIFDEAHELEEVASNYFGIGLSTQRIDELTRDIESMLKAKDSLSSSIVSSCTTLKDRSRLFFSALPGEDPFAPPAPGRMPFEQRESLPRRIRRHLHRHPQRTHTPRVRARPAPQRRRGPPASASAPPTYEITSNSSSNPQPPTPSSGSSAAPPPASATSPARKPPSTLTCKPPPSTSPSSSRPPSSSSTPPSSSPLPPSP